MWKISIFSILYLLSALPFAASASAPDAHICKESDLTGTFNLITMKETPAAQELSWYQNYRWQYISFHSEHTYDFVALRHRLKDMGDFQASVKASTFDGATPVMRKYTLDGTGLLNLYLNDRIDYSYRCLVLDKGYDKAGAGDLEFEGYSKQNTLLDKFFHRWP